MRPPSFPIDTLREALGALHSPVVSPTGIGAHNKAAMVYATAGVAPQMLASGGTEPLQAVVVHAVLTFPCVHTRCLPEAV